VRGFSHWIITLFASPGGVIVLAALDSTLFFSLPFGIDAAVIILAARLHGAAWAVPLLATTGSLAGAATTFWMGVKVGEKGLDRYASPKRLTKVRKKIRESGAIALAILDLIPPPFPFTPFVLAAGALGVDVWTFFVTLAVCRLGRFGAETVLAVVYGRHILSWLDSPILNDVVIGCTALAGLLTTISLVKIFRTSGRPRRRHAPA
jgi:membrane protein YqaA with SNARE-associated domain